MTSPPCAAFEHLIDGEITGSSPEEHAQMVTGAAWSLDSTAPHRDDLHLAGATRDGLIALYMQDLADIYLDGLESAPPDASFCTGTAGFDST